MPYTIRGYPDIAEMCVTAEYGLLYNENAIFAYHPRKECASASIVEAAYSIFTIMVSVKQMDVY